MTFSSKEYVSSGSFRIENKGKKSLVAILGTCVAVSLSDSKSGVGGMIHLLLPAPTGGNAGYQPENYASIGLPVFIGELIKAGAQKQNLEAVIAGGALFGPISRQDINFNVGGRTTEVVEKILKRDNIPIVKSETGGLMGSKLTLDTSTWQASITPLYHEEKGDSVEECTRPSSAEIDEMIDNIKPIPQIALKIIRLLREEDHCLKDLSDELKSDQVLSAKVITLCNSVAIGAKRYIDSIDQALLLLGETHLLEAVVSAAVDSFFAQKEGGYALMRGGLYTHALGVAHSAKVISHFTGRGDAGTAYTAGLLHDIGKVVLDHYFEKSSPLFYQPSPEDSLDYVEQERSALGVDHQEVGRRLAEIWYMPENLAEAIALHHYPEKAVVDKELVHIVYLSDLCVFH